MGGRAELAPDSFARVIKRRKCKFVPRFLSMIVGLTVLSKNLLFDFNCVNLVPT